MNKLIDKKQAIDYIQNNDTVMIGGFTNFGSPLHLMYELAQRDIRDLTIISEDLGYGGMSYDQGQGVLLSNGQVKEAIVSFVGGYPLVNQLVEQGKLKLTLVPQGTLAERIRAGDAGIGGFYTPTGVGTVVEEDVGFGPENMGVPTDDIWKRVNDSLEKVGMTAYRYQSPNKLSGGQKQRVAIAGVMAMRPRCIILDEPTAMLDPNGRKEVLEAVRELNRKEKVTVILITHYMEEVIHADRVYVMDSGNVVMQGNPKEIFSQVDTLKAYGLDVPQVTLLAYELKKSGVDVPDGILTTEELVSALCQSN